MSVKGCVCHVVSMVIVRCPISGSVSGSVIACVCHAEYNHSHSTLSYVMYVVYVM